jgi:hypothetical protein
LTPDEYHAVQDVFLAVCHLSAEERELELESRCGKNRAMRRAVESLISMDAKSAGPVQRHERLGGLLSSYYREAA